MLETVFLKKGSGFKCSRAAAAAAAAMVEVFY